VESAGGLAQDVEKQLPELAITDKISNKKAVNYGDVIIAGSNSSSLQN
jgi:hypothetical protein